MDSVAAVELAGILRNDYRFTSTTTTKNAVGARPERRPAPPVPEDAAEGARDRPISARADPGR